jgi:inner membrane protein
MDSLSQLALGSALGVAVLGRHTPVWKAALWGGLAGTLPDLDALIDFGDPIRNMTYHRAESHSLFYLTLLAPLLALLATRLHGAGAGFHRWGIALWLALFTHPLLDWMTVYGTQLGLPFTATPFGLGSIFIIDPLYTLPLVFGVTLALSRRSLRWNTAGLVVSCAYLAWSATAQARVALLADRSLARQGIEVQQVLVTPTPFNTVLWRVVAMTSTGYVEAFHSFFDPGTDLRFDHYGSAVGLREPLRGIWGFDRMAWFTQGFYALSEREGRAIITDLRMGQEPSYVFAFAVAQRGSAFHEIPPERTGDRGDPGALLAWTWHRLRGRAGAASPSRRSRPPRWR